MDHKPLLPSLATILHSNKTRSEPGSPLFSAIKSNCFKTDGQGVIKLPPLLNSAKQPQTPYSASKNSISHANLSSVTPHTSMVRFSSFSGAIDASPSKINQNEIKSLILDTPVSSKRNVTVSKERKSMMTPTSVAKNLSASEKKKEFAFISHSQETFPSKEPSIDNAPLARRKRRRTSKNELNILQAEFEACSTPDKQKRIELAQRCSMSEKAVQIWFQNKRQSVKKHKRIATTVTSNPVVDAVAPINTPGPQPTTPLSVKFQQASTRNTLQLHTPTTQVPSNATAPTVMVSSTPEKKTTPTRENSPTAGGQALTFRLKSDKKVLTPIQTSPNNRVNKLINGSTSSPTATSPTKNTGKKTKLDFKEHDPSTRKEAVLKVLDLNTLKR